MTAICLPGLAFDFPLVVIFVVPGPGDPRFELDILAQIELVGDIVEITQSLRLGGEMLAPVPFLQQFVGERITVTVAFGIEARAGVAVPVPCAAGTLKPSPRNL
jgi:hypothetical protein